MSFRNEDFRLRVSDSPGILDDWCGPGLQDLLEGEVAEVCIDSRLWKKPEEGPVADMSRFFFLDLLRTEALDRAVRWLATGVDLSHLSVRAEFRNDELVLFTEDEAYIFLDGDNNDTCSACEDSFQPQKKDHCPGCGSRDGLISTIGTAQALRLINGERYSDTPLGNADVAGRYTKVPGLRRIEGLSEDHQVLAYAVKLCCEYLGKKQRQDFKKGAER